MLADFLNHNFIVIRYLPEFILKKFLRTFLPENLIEKGVSGLQFTEISKSLVCNKPIIMKFSLWIFFGVERVI